MTQIINGPALSRGLPVADPGRALAAAVLAGLIREGQVAVTRHPDCIDFCGTPGDINAVAVRVRVDTNVDAEVARWLNIDADLIEPGMPDGQ
jgi:hypothetical protein